MSQHTGIAESRRVNKHLYETICNENNNYKFECVCIQRCSETKNNNHFYYLVLATEPNGVSNEIWLTLEECSDCPKLMEAVNVFVKNERQQVAQIEITKKSHVKNHSIEHSLLS